MAPTVLELLRPAGRRTRGPTLSRATWAALVVVVFVANAAGACVVFAIAALVLPGAQVDDESTVRLVNGAIAAAYLLVAVVAGLVAGRVLWRPVLQWLREERPPEEAVQRRALRSPFVVLGLQAVLWTVAAALFGGVNLLFSFELALRVAIAVALGGITTSAVAYLLAEQIFRPVAARALAERPPPKLVAPGVPVRFLLAWALGTAVPVLGLVLLGIAQLADRDAKVEELALTMVVLGGVALIVGFLAVMLTARTVGGPVRSVRDAVRRVERGELDVEVRVDDGSELGRLQAGVNQMVKGLREREALRDMFGRHVGEDVAREALDRGIELGGETREVAVLFVDLVGSTELASARPPHEVVELLNRFFTIVVEVVDEHGGFVNKFEGDAALAIFGAPTPLESSEARVLAAARKLGRRLREEVPDLEAGIGVSAGEVVAGNIGSQRRFEYTVIGDPVNEAARLTETAKEVDGGVVANARLIEQAGDGEARHWKTLDEVTLRGRKEPTRIAAPAQ